jgi:hypothetical protein
VQLASEVVPPAVEAYQIRKRQGSEQGRLYSKRSCTTSSRGLPNTEEAGQRAGEAVQPAHIRALQIAVEQTWPVAAQAEVEQRRQGASQTAVEQTRSGAAPASVEQTSPGSVAAQNDVEQTSPGEPQDDVE